MLLGGFLLDSEDSVVQKQLENVSDDRLERIYYWLRSLRMYTFRVKFKDSGDYYLARRSAEKSFPVFDNNGLLQDSFSISVRCIKENNEDKEERQFTIDRDNIPEEIWYTTYADSYPIDYAL